MLEEPTLELTELISGEELAALSDVGPCELIKGKIVHMSPTGFLHGRIEASIGAALLQFVREHDLGEVYTGEVGIYTGRNPDTVRAADVIFISHARFAEVRAPTFLDVAPELVVEVLSPSDSWSEVTQKLREYFAIGVDLVWVVEPQTRRVFAYAGLTNLQEFTANDKITADAILPGFSAPVARFFSR